MEKLRHTTKPLPETDKIAQSHAVIVRGGYSERSRTIDIVKAIAIILMVWVHADGPWGNYFGLFHMAVFFM